MKKLLLFIVILLLAASLAIQAGLETGTYIDDLVTTNPTSSDSATQGDDHLRLIKSTIKATFPNIDGPVTATEDDLNTPSIPAGVMMWYPGGTVPTGWNECDGSSLNRTTYASLFTAISTTYGTADGTSFNIPDVRGYFIRAQDNARGIDPNAGTRTATTKTGATMSAGDNVGTEQDDIVGGHNHNLRNQGDDNFDVTGGSTFIGKDGGALAGSSALRSNAMEGTGTGVGSETRPINIYMKCIIYLGT